ncbi:MAG: beta-xylosidase [Candidatus Acidiferrum sp.]
MQFAPFLSKTLFITFRRERPLVGPLALGFAFAIFLFNGSLRAQSAPPEAALNIKIHVDAAGPQTAMPPAWNYFGYDEPNYTYAPNGKKLLGELSVASPVPVYIRTHNLLTSGDGSASLKWGSTNAYTEDASGHAVYSWTIVDQIFDAYRSAGVKPLVEIGFMPEALSTHPTPYRHNFPDGSVFTGWAYPPRDYAKWAELVFQFAHHLRGRYGDREVRTWLWEVWNEPDIDYWKGTPQEFLKLYDYAADALLGALPGAKIGGPDSTGPGSDKAAEFLRLFLDHCAHGTNFATGKKGAPLDFISFHPKGAPKWEENHVRMGMAQQLKAIQRGFQVVGSFPEWRQTPIILGESDPEGCAACSAKKNPQNSYRNGPLYGCYTVAVLNQIYSLAEREHVNFQAAVTWAFEFEGQPYFEGFRDLATNGINKPVLNAFRMLGLLSDRRIPVTSDGRIPTEEIVQSGVRGRPDVDAIATRKDHQVEVLLWNYHDDDMTANTAATLERGDAANVESTTAAIALAISGLPQKVSAVLVEQFRIDDNHSNAFTAWRQQGSPQHPSVDQYARLEDASQLRLLNSPQWMKTDGTALALRLNLPRQGVSLLRISW